jgi:hypothetical protein
VPDENAGHISAEDARESYYGYTARASDVIRQLGFASIGIIWLFKVDRGTHLAVPRLLAAGALLSVASLSLDLLQYLYGSAAWGIFHGLMERRGQEHALAPRVINLPTLVCFWAKASLMVFAYICILGYLKAVLQVAL